MMKNRLTNFSLPEVLMKHKKFWKGVLSFLSVVIAVTAINMGIKVAMEGMWLLGIPKPEAVSSVTIKHQYETEQIKEITDPEQIETCVHLTGFLKYRPFADPEVATGKASPLITFYYHLADGDTVEVAANANTVFLFQRLCFSLLNCCLHRFCKTSNIPVEIKQKQCRYHKENTVGKYSPGGKNGVISKATYFLCENRIAGPDQCRQQSQQISHRVQLQL